MAEQNIKMNVKTDTGYDTLYPQTKADIVNFNKSGSNLGATNVDSAIKEVNTKADERIEKTKTLTTLSEVLATKEQGFLPDALVVKEILSDDKYTHLINRWDAYINEDYFVKINSIMYGKTYSVDTVIGSFTLSQPIESLSGIHDGFGRPQTSIPVTALSSLGGHKELYLDFNGNLKTSERLEVGTYNYCFTYFAQH